MSGPAVMQFTRTSSSQSTPQHHQMRHNAAPPLPTPTPQAITKPRYLPPQNWQPNQYSPAPPGSGSQRPPMPLRRQTSQQSMGTPQGGRNVTPLPQGRTMQQHQQQQSYQPPPPPPPPRPVFWEEPYAGPLKLFKTLPRQRRPQKAYPITEQPTQQALETSFPSRMSMGVSLLVQPKEITGCPSEGHFEGLGPSTRQNEGSATPQGYEVNRFGRQTRRRINYAEDGRDDDFDDDDDDDNNAASRRKQTMIQDAAARAAEERRKQVEAEMKLRESWSYLGERPAADRIRQMAYNKDAVGYPLYFRDDVVDLNSEMPSYLVPIRIEFETDKLRIRDCFTWNIEEALIQPEDFARIFCHDLSIDANTYSSTIADEIRRQINEWREVVQLDVENGYEQDDRPGSRVRKPVDLVTDSDMSDEEREERRAKRQKLTKREKREREAEHDCRVIVNIEVQISTFMLRDRIEWDLGSTLTPERFTTSYCAELGLTGEALPIISHAIHEELLRHKREAYERGLLRDGAGLHEEKTSLGGSLPLGTAPKRLRGVWRDWTERQEFGPTIEQVSIQEMERREREDGSRTARRARREAAKWDTTRSSRRRDI